MRASASALASTFGSDLAGGSDIRGAAFTAGYFEDLVAAQFFHDVLVGRRVIVDLHGLAVVERVAEHFADFGVAFVAW